MKVRHTFNPPVDTNDELADWCFDICDAVPSASIAFVARPWVGNDYPELAVTLDVDDEHLLAAFLDDTLDALVNDAYDTNRTIL